MSIIKDKDFTFENQLSGEILLKGKIYEASLYMTYKYCTSQSWLTLQFDLPPCVKIKANTNFSMNIFVNDSSSDTPCNTISVNNETFSCDFSYMNPSNCVINESAISNWIGLDFTNPQCIYSYMSNSPYCTYVSFSAFFCCYSSTWAYSFNVGNLLQLYISGPTEDVLTYNVQAWGDFTSLAINVVYNDYDSCVNKSPLIVIVNETNTRNSVLTTFTLASDGNYYTTNNETYALYALPFSTES